MIPTGRTIEHVFDTGGDDAHGLIREGVAALAERDARAMSNVALSAAILAALTLAERLTAEATRLVGEWDTRRAWRDDGALSATSWLVHRAPVTRADALDLVCAWAGGFDAVAEVLKGAACVNPVGQPLDHRRVLSALRGEALHRG